MLLDPKAFATVAGVSDRRAGEIFAEGHWHGFVLPVVQLPGHRGGKGGTVWALAVDRCDPELQAKLVAVKPALEDPSRFVPIEVVRDLLDDRKAQIATMRETEAEAKIGAAIKEGHITPAMRPWATALCRQDPALFDDFLAKSPAPFAHLSRPVTFGNAVGTASEKAAHSAEAAAICAQLDLSPDALNC